MAEPRLRRANGGVSDLADEAAEFAEAAGIELLPWQAEVLRDWSQLGRDGKFVNHRAGASIPRQAGKSVDGICWVAFLVAMLGYSVLWTDHNYSTTCEMLKRFRRIFGRRPADPNCANKAMNSLVTAASSKTAQEWFEFRNGGLLAFSTRTDSAGLGFSFDVIVFDEAQELTNGQQQALLPTTSSGPHKNTQYLYLGTPTRAGSTATVFSSVRDEALAGGAADLAWVEYGVEEVGDVTDEARWSSANPSLESGLADADAIRAACHSMHQAGDDLAFAQDYLGYWIPKATASAVIDRDDWEACAIETPPGGAADGFGVKFSSDGLVAAMAVAMSRPDGGTHVELIQAASTAQGTRGLAEAVVRAAAVAPVAVDGRSGAQALVDRVEGSVPPGSVSLVSTADATAACSELLDEVREHTLTWYRPGGQGCDDRLSCSALTSGRRPMGSRGGWGFGGEDPAPVEAAALALWQARKSCTGQDMEVYF